LADDELCTGQQLSPFLDETLSLAEQLDRVCRLHNVLEIATLVKNFMDLPLQNMRELVAFVLLCCLFFFFFTQIPLSQSCTRVLQNGFKLGAPTVSGVAACLFGASGQGFGEPCISFGRLT
jgi:hypothetical protein